MFEPSKAFGVEDSVSVTLENRPHRVLGLIDGSPSALNSLGRIGGEDLELSFFDELTHLMGHALTDGALIYQAPMFEVPSAKDRIIVVGDFPEFTAMELFDHFVQPELVVAWWPQLAITDPVVGGEYCFSWPEQNWHLRGEYTAIEPGEHIGFTWAWDHESDSRGPNQVDLFFAALEQGQSSRLAVHHGPFELNNGGQADRQGIVEGWIHFGMRLAGLRSVED